MIEDDNRVLNYRGLEYLVNKLKGNMIKDVLVYKGYVATVSALDNIENPLTGWVYHVEETGAEYFYNGTEWEYAGEIINVHYTSEEAAGTKSVAVGGISANTDVSKISGKTVSQVFDMILFPDAEPTHTNESITLNYNGSRSVRYGTTAPAASDFYNTVSKGTWNYYSDTSNYAGDYSVGNVSGTFAPSKLTSNTTYSQTVTFTSTNAGTPTTKKGVDRSNLKYNKTGDDAKKSSTVTISVWKPYFIGKYKAGYTPSDTEWFTGASTTSDNVTTVNVVTTESDNSTYTGLKSITGDVTGNNGHIFIAVPTGSPVLMYDPGFTDVQWTMKAKVTKSGTISTGVSLSYDIYVKDASGVDTQVYIKTS